MTPCPITAPNKASNTILKFPLCRKLSFNGLTDVLPSVLSFENIGDSFIFNRIYTETPTRNIDIQNGYRHPPHSALNCSSVMLSFTSMITPRATNKPSVAVVWIQEV